MLWHSYVFVLNFSWKKNNFKRNRTILLSDERFCLFVFAFFNFFLIVFFLDQFQ